MSEIQNNWPVGIKKTKQRISVLQVLEHAHKPLSAMEISAQMEGSGDAAWLSTVYRVLELFVREGLVIKTTMINSDMALYELNRYKHKHYAVCMNCRKIIAMDNCPMESFIPELDDKEFQVMGHNLEVYGLCKDCCPKKPIPPA